MSPPNPSQWLSIEQVLEYLPVTKMTVYREIDRGKLTAYQFGRQLWVKPEDLQTYLSRSRYVPNGAASPPSPPSPPENLTRHDTR